MTLGDKNFADLVWEGNHVQITRERLVMTVVYSLKSKATGKVFAHMRDGTDAINMAAEIDLIMDKFVAHRDS